MTAWTHPLSGVIYACAVRYYSSICTPNLKCPASPVPRYAGSAKKIKKWVTWPRPRPFEGRLSSWGYLIIALYTKFDDPSFNRSRDMIGPQNLKWVMWPSPLPFQEWFVNGIAETWLRNPWTNNKLTNRFERTLNIFCILQFLQRAQCSHCNRCISYSNSVCPSVRPSVCPSVTRRYCVKTTARSTVQFACTVG